VSGKASVIVKLCEYLFWTFGDEAAAFLLK
jgi:hypothetical protein